MKTDSQDENQWCEGCSEEDSRILQFLCIAGVTYLEPRETTQAALRGQSPKVELIWRRFEVGCEIRRFDTRKMSKCQRT